MKFLSFKGSKGEKSALELKKRILRHCLFSYALVMASVSKAFEKLYPGSEEYVVKGLATYDFDIHNLKNENGSDVGWMDKWWVPINWSCALIQKETDSEGHAPKESKEIIAKLISFKSYLREVLEFHHNPLPAMMSQAVYLVCWGFLIFGAFAHQPCNGSYSGVWWIFEVHFETEYFKMSYCCSSLAGSAPLPAFDYSAVFRMAKNGRDLQEPLRRRCFLRH